MGYLSMWERGRGASGVSRTASIVVDGVMGAVALVAVSLLPAPSASAASQTTIQGMQLMLPGAAEGWTSKTVTGGVMLQKAFPETEDDDKGAALIQILSATRGGFDGNFETLVKTIPELAEERPTVKSAGLTVNGHAIRVESRCCESRGGVDLSMVDVGVDAKGRQIFLKLLFLNLDRDRRKATEEEFRAVVASLRMAPDDKPFALSPLPGGGGLDGVYTYLDTGLRPNTFGGMDFYSESRIMAFDPKGLYSTEIPKGGDDIAAHCRGEAQDCGLYRLKGGGFFVGAKEIELLRVADVYGVLEPETKAFARDGSDLKLGEREYRHIPPLPKGATFDGSWHYSYGSSGMTATSSGMIAVERTLVLSRDGRFRRTGSTAISSTNEIGGSRTGVTSGHDRPIESGRYEAEGYGITLIGTDGRRERLSLFRPDGDSDGLLVIDGGNYLKTKD